MAEASFQESLSPIRTVRQWLAGFFPATVFGLVLLLAIGRFGLILGIIIGIAMGAVTAWALVRLIAAYPPAQWFAAIVVAALLALFVLSFF